MPGGSVISLRSLCGFRQESNPGGDANPALFQATVGSRKFNDLLGVFGQMEEAHPAMLHWYLPWFGVDCALQGQGACRRRPPADPGTGRRGRGHTGRVLGSLRSTPSSWASRQRAGACLAWPHIRTALAATWPIASACFPGACRMRKPWTVFTHTSRAARVPCSERASSGFPPDVRQAAQVIAVKFPRIEL